MKKFLIMTAALLLLTAEASAAKRYYAFRLTPKQVTSIIEREGKVILYFRAKNPAAELLFLHVVNSIKECSSYQMLKKKKIPAARGKLVKVKYCFDIPSPGLQVSNPVNQPAPTPTPPAPPVQPPVEEIPD